MREEQEPSDIVFDLYILPCLKPLHFSFTWDNKSLFHLIHFRSGFLLVGTKSLLVITDAIRKRVLIIKYPHKR